MLPVRQNILPISAFFLIAPLRSDTHVRRAQLIAGSIMRPTRTFVTIQSVTIEYRVARTLRRNFAHAAAVIVTGAHGCLTAAGHCYVMLGTIEFVDKSVNDNSARRLDHRDVIALRAGSVCPLVCRTAKLNSKLSLSHLQQLIWYQTQINTCAEHLEAHPSNPAGQFMTLV